MTDGEKTAILYFSDDGTGTGDTQLIDLTTLSRATADGTDRMYPISAWWSVDGAVQLDVDDTGTHAAATGGFIQFMDFAGNSGGWVNLPMINADDIAAGSAGDGDGGTGDFQITNNGNGNFSLCIKFIKRSGFSERPRLHRNDGGFDVNR